MTSRTTLSADGAECRRIIDIESRLNGILDILSQRKLPQSSDSAFPQSTNPVNAFHFTDDNDLGSDLPHISRSDQVDTNDIALTAGSTLLASVVPEPLAHTHEGASMDWTVESADARVSTAVLQYLLNEFAKMTEHFPFVRIPHAYTVSMMARERPFLLLAAATAAASDYPELQRTFEVEMKESLSQYLIMGSEKTLDLLQGLLVHIAWSITLVAHFQVEY